jgi:hypothetical protein
MWGFHVDQTREIRADWESRHEFWTKALEQAQTEQDLLGEKTAAESLAFLLDTEPPQAPETLRAAKVKADAAEVMDSLLVQHQRRAAEQERFMNRYLYQRERLARECLECGKATRNSDEAGDPWCTVCLSRNYQALSGPVVEMTHVPLWSTKICHDCSHAAMATFDERPFVGVCKHHFRDLNQRHRLHLKRHASGHYSNPLVPDREELRQEAAKLVRAVPKTDTLCDYCKKSIPAKAFRVWNNGKAVCSDCYRGIFY